VRRALKQRLANGCFQRFQVRGDGWLTDEKFLCGAGHAAAAGDKAEDVQRIEIISAFQKVVAEYPNTPLAREAEGNIYEFDSLNLGQPAPIFAYRGINGEPVSLADFRGKVTLLNFWASW
jgi:hypothetical protein